MILKKFLIILLAVLIVIGISVSLFFISARQVSPARPTAPSHALLTTPNIGQPTSDISSLAINQVSPPPTLSTRKKAEYVEGQYIEGVWKVRERVQDCGGGKTCLNYLVIQLPEEMSTNDIRAIRINVSSCVDETLRTGDMARVRGVIEKVIPDIGLNLSCNSSKTSVAKN